VAFREACCRDANTNGRSRSFGAFSWSGTDTTRAFYGNQFGLTLPLFAHHGVQLWVPEVGGPIDPNNEAHDLVMSVFGGMSKGERDRIKVRVRCGVVVVPDWLNVSSSASAASTVGTV
jgi:hypothetical protein